MIWVKSADGVQVVNLAKMDSVYHNRMGKQVIACMNEESWTIFSGTPEECQSFFDNLCVRLEAASK